VTPVFAVEWVADPLEDPWDAPPLEAWEEAPPLEAWLDEVLEDFLSLLAA
jgi:hypothetical protein